MKDTTAAERKARERSLRKAAGLTLKQVWVKEGDSSHTRMLKALKRDEIKYLKRYVAEVKKDN